MKILFICSSNICRSPYCEFIFRRMVENDAVLKNKNITVRSAAVFNRSFKIHPKAVVALRAKGFSDEDINAHKTAFKWRDRYLFKEADIIIGMTRAHKVLLPAKYRCKYKSLSEVAINKYVPVPDPFLKKTQAEYDKTMRILDEYLEDYRKNLVKHFQA